MQAAARPPFPQQNGPNHNQGPVPGPHMVPGQFMQQQQQQPGYNNHHQQPQPGGMHYR